MAKRKTFEALLKQVATSHRAVFEWPSVGWVLLDPGTGRFVRVNRRFCEITGYTAEELLTLTVGEITHPEDFDRDRELVERYKRGDVLEFVSEKRYFTKHG